MTSSDQNTPAPSGQKRSLSRRFAWLAFAIVAAIGLYTAGWYYAASRLEAEVARTIADLRARGAEAECTRAEARGYPFRIGLFCDGVAYSDALAGISLSGTGLRSAAQVYQPTRIVGELDRIALGFAPLGLDVVASGLRYSTRLANPLPELASVAGSSIEAASTAGTRLAAASSAQAHMRPRGADIDLAGEIAGLQLEAVAGVPSNLPPLDARWDLSVVDGIARLRAADRSLRGLSTELRTASLRSGAVSIAVAGPLAVDSAGLVDATLTIRITDPKGLVGILRGAFPQMRPQLAQAEALLSAMGDNPTLPLSISKGVMRMGFFTVGRIPPLA